MIISPNNEQTEILTEILKWFKVHHSRMLNRS